MPAAPHAEPVAVDRGRIARSVRCGRTPPPVHLSSAPGLPSRANLSFERSQRRSRMTATDDGRHALARGGSATPLSTSPVVGTPARAYSPQFVPGAEPLAPGEIRVTILGSGDPWIRRSQASGSLLVEVGNAEKDFFFFDLGLGCPRELRRARASGRVHHQGLPLAPARRSHRRHPRAAGQPGEGRPGRPRRDLGRRQRGPGARASRPSASTWARRWPGTPPRSAGVRPTTRLRGDRPRDPLRPARHDLRPQRRHGLELPGHPRPERRRRLRDRVRGPQGRLLGRHPSLPPRGGGRGGRRPADPRVLPVPGGVRPRHRACRSRWP